MADFWHLKPSFFIENISDIKYPRLTNKKIVVVILRQLNYAWVVTLREKYPNTEFFLVRVFPHSNWIRRDTPYLSVFNSNAEKHRPEKTPHFDTFHAVSVFFKVADLKSMGNGWEFYNIYVLSIENIPQLFVVLNNDFSRIAVFS